MSTAATVVLVVLVLAALLVAGWFGSGAARRRRLRKRFGPEYERSVAAAENRRAAERELAEREKRYAQLNLRPLSAEASARFTERWVRVQERFVDEPGASVLEADELVHAVMRERGYPTDSFEQQAADLSVEHATAVDDYRNGYQIRTRHERGEATTEELRKALVHYRAIFHSLTGTQDTDEHRTDARTAEPRSTEPRPAEPRSTEPRSASAEPRSADARSAEARSAEPRSADAQADEARAAEARSAEARSMEARSAEGRSTEVPTARQAEHDRQLDRARIQH